MHTKTIVRRNSIFSGYPPEQAQEGIRHEISDTEGKTIIGIWKQVIIVNSYVVCSGMQLQSLNERHESDLQMRMLLKAIQNKYKRPIIWTGDKNTSIQDIDVWDGALSKDRENYAGCTAI